MFLIGSSGNDPKNDFEKFLKNYAWLLCVIVALIIIAVIVIIFVLKNKKGANKKPLTSEKSSDKWLEALGGKDNILEISSTGSRLSVKLANKDLVNRDALTELGIKSIVQMSDKLTLVSDLDNSIIVENIQKSLQN